MRIENNLILEKDIHEGDLVLYDCYEGVIGLVVDHQKGYAIYTFEGEELVKYDNYADIDLDKKILKHWDKNTVLATLDIMGDML